MATKSKPKSEPKRMLRLSRPEGGEHLVIASERSIRSQMNINDKRKPERRISIEEVLVDENNKVVQVIKPWYVNNHLANQRMAHANAELVSEQQKEIERLEAQIAELKRKGGNS